MDIWMDAWKDEQVDSKKEIQLQVYEILGPNNLILLFRFS